jgi:hypothetical protein
MSDFDKVMAEEWTDDGDRLELVSHELRHARTGRIVIAGGPRCGKTTLSRRIAAIMGLDLLAVRHTDDLVGVLEWSEASAQVAEWLEAPGPFICEGVAVPRALRKWLAAHDTGAPCDVLLYLTEPFETLLKGQAAMAKGCRTVFDEIEPELRARGVEIAMGAAPSLAPTPVKQ